MHDLVRDMAMFITSKDDNKFLVQYGKVLKEWQPRNDTIKTCKKISLMGTKITKLPDYKLDLPDLDTLLIQDNYELSIVPDEFLQSMEKLKVLDMSHNRISSLPESLKHLRNLRTLYLSGNSSLCEISILGELTFLEILVLRETGIRTIPKEIGKLINLRVLDVDYTSPIYVTPGVISKFIWLEEFYIGIGEGDCTFVGELNKLKSLKVLHLKVPELQYLPQDFHFENLIEFHIKDNVVWLSRTHGCKRILEISQHSFPLRTPFTKLIQVSEMLNVWKINDLENYFLQVVYPAGFEKLRYIDLFECENVKSLVKTSDLDELVQRKSNVKFFSQVEEISLRQLDSLQLLCDSPHQYISFSHLMKIYITACPSLTELFPLSVARGLAKLRELYISHCKSLVAVISDGDEQTAGSEIGQTSGISEIELVATDNVFDKLDSIHLSALPELESFYRGYSIIKYPSLKFIQVKGCPSMKRWSYGENDIPNIKFEHEGRSSGNINDYITVQLEMDDGELRMRDWRRDATEANNPENEIEEFQEG